MKITPTALSIAQLLSTQSERFIVPAYQRRYSWRPKHIKELFNDISTLQSGDTHLLGSIVCLTSSLRPGINELELVDGQQRMTTLMVFLNAIEERLKRQGDPDELRMITSYLHCKDYTGKVMDKLALGDLDSKDFALVMKNSHLEDMINRNLYEAHLLAMSLVNELSEEEFHAFRYKLINQANVIRLDVAEAKDAFKLFETINNRGLTLSPADIIKNFLLGNASLIDSETLDSVRASWTGVVLALDTIDMDDFFRQYTITMTGRKVTQSQLIDTFKRQYSIRVLEAGHSEQPTDEDADKATEPIDKVSIDRFTNQLRQAAELYQKIVLAKYGDEKIDRHLRNLKKIRSFASYTFVLNLLQRDISRKEVLEVLSMLETFMLRRNVAEYRTNELEDIFAKLTRITDENLAAKVYKVLRDNLPSDQEFYDKLLSHDFRGQLENRAKYMLERIEYHITGDTGEKVIASNEEVHLEHIVPQTIDTKKSKREYGDWQEYLGIDVISKHREYLAKLGNLTLLGAPLNIHASNNPFKSKLSGGRDESGKSKESDYSKSTIELTGQLLDYEEFKFEQIESRGQYLANLSLDIWKLPEYDIPDDDEAATNLSGGIRVACEQGQIAAVGTWYDDGRILVQEGSSASATTAASFGYHTYRPLRDRLVADGILEPTQDGLVFTQDYEFDSPSAAAACVLGRSANGVTEWKDAGGRTIKELIEHK